MNDEEPTMLGQGRPTASLVIRQGTQAGMSFPISGTQVIIGREEGLDVVLQDPEASRRHTRISWQGGRYVAEDLGSTNGTFINGVQITAPQGLNPGDSIGIGQTAMVFQMVGGQPTDVMQGGFPQQGPTYYNPPPANPPASDNKLTQYLLYGCGCLLLIAICFLLGIVVWALADPQSFENVTGIGIAFNNLMQTYPHPV